MQTGALLFICKPDAYSGWNGEFQPFTSMEVIIDEK
jgi:hypothetical protein